jgi:glycosyltransferase involved in cell wall biosynthesis
VSISICVPAYKRTAYLKRLLDSIAQQTYRDFEVVVTDDSPDESVKNLCSEYQNSFVLHYFKNETSLGTPANWNHGISKAKGEWIKLIHDDDWFVSEKSLEEFAAATIHGKKFIFSAYQNKLEGSSETQPKSFPPARGRAIIQNPLLLLAENIIGPPSVTLVHRSIAQQYDTNMKWRVDIDFYIRVLKQEKNFHYINEQLINVGISESQVTNVCIDKPEVELPEGLLLLLKYGVQPLKNILVYDAWWRILRNVGVRNRKQLERYTPYKEWPAAILKMVTHQSKIPVGILKTGVFSKLFMTTSYLFNYRYLAKYK